jgi:hypothetical protein
MENNYIRTVMNGIIELVWVPLGIVIGWIYHRQNKLEEALDKKADKDDLHEMVSLISEIRDMLTEVRLEVAKWVGKLEGQATRKG